jgi:protein dithiol:quinone oxidoreductase
MKPATALSRQAVWGLMALASFGAVAGAWVAQHYADMQPCPWCVLQRLIYLLIGAVSLLAATLPAPAAGGVAAGIGRLGTLTSGVLAALLAASGAAAATYQNLVAAKSPSCNLTLADRIVSGLGLDVAVPDLFEARASCADAAVDLLGLPLELWGLALFLALWAAAVWQIRAAIRA